MMRSILAAILCLAGLLAGQPAAAHAVLLAMSPADGSAVPESPAAVVLRFDEPVTPVLVRLLDAQARPVTGPEAVTARDAEVRIALAKPLAAGTYLVSYRVVSLDSHPVAATLSFTVGSRPATAVASPLTTAADRFWPVAAAAGRTLFLAGLLASAGGALFHWLVAGGLGGLPRPDRAWLMAMALAAIAAGLLDIGIEGADLLGEAPGLPSAAAWRLGAATSLGGSLLVAAAALAMLVAALWRRGAAAGFAAKAAAILALLSPVMTGHVATAEPRWLTMPALGLHALAAGFWAGALAPLWARLRRLPAAAALRLLGEFSRLAVGAVGLLVLAGLVMATVQLRGLAGLDSAYGARLAVKLGLVLLLLGVAAGNRLWLTPALGAGHRLARGRLRASIAAEVLLMVAILAATATLGQSVPPRTIATAAQAARAVPAVSVHAHRDGSMAVIEVTPGRTGRNDVTLRLTDPAGAPLAAQEASLELANAAAGIEPMGYRLTAAGPGLYRLTGVPIAVAGSWSLRLDALVSDFSQLTFTATLPIR